MILNMNNNNQGVFLELLVAAKNSNTGGKFINAAYFMIK